MKEYAAWLGIGLLSGLLMFGTVTCVQRVASFKIRTEVTRVRHVAAYTTYDTIYVGKHSVTVPRTVPAEDIPERQWQNERGEVMWKSDY